VVELLATVEQAQIAPNERWQTIPDGLPKYTLGWGAIKWGIKYLRQPDGDNSGDRWQFTDSQIRFLLWYYAIDETTRWIYSHAVRRLPKGSGKSPFAAVMALIELCGPVRFAKWAGNEPIGKPVGMPLVQIAGTAQEQGLINTMRMVRALIVATKNDGTVDFSKKSRLITDYGLEVGKTLIYKPGGGQLHVITSSANAAEGALTTFGICDQTEAWYKSNGGHDLFQVMDRNAAKSKSRLVQTANAWEPGKDSVTEQTFDAWVKEQEGRTIGTAKTLMDVRMAPPDSVQYFCRECGAKDCREHDISQRQISRDALVRGVSDAYGDCHWVDAEDIVDRHILDPKTPFDVSKRFYLNWPTSASDAWVEKWEWSRWGNPLLLLAEGAEIALGFDGSRTNDATALVACEISTGNIFDFGVWETEPLQGGGRLTVPVDEVDAAVERAFLKWNPVAFFGDVREWESFTKVEWPKRYGSQLKVHAVPSGRDPQPIAWDMRTHTGEFTSACEMVNEEITGDSAVFQHDGSSVIGRHVVNSRRRPNKWGTSIGKESPDSPNKIDSCVAMIIARHARRLYLASLMAEDIKKSNKKPHTGRVRGYDSGDSVNDLKFTVSEEHDPVTGARTTFGKPPGWQDLSERAPF
jgi:hypothetical protein